MSLLILVLILSLGILCFYKFANNKKLQHFYNIGSFIHSIGVFPEIQYFANYSKQEKRTVKRNNQLNYIIIANILLLVILFLFWMEVF